MIGTSPPIEAASAAFAAASIGDRVDDPKKRGFAVPQRPGSKQIPDEAIVAHAPRMKDRENS